MSSILAITYDDVIAVTPSDTVDDPNGPFAGFYISGTAGTVTFLTVRGHAGIISPGAGVIVPFAIRRIYSSGTSATGVYGCIAMPFKGKGPS